MGGFFTKKETASKSRPDGKSYSCAACGLYRKCRSPRMEPFGNFKKKILNIGEAPGEVEDRNGRPWQGKSGKLLQRTYEKLGIDLFEDCLNINAVNCRPTDKNGSNRVPTNFEAECCRKSILKVIKEYSPKVIVLFGNMAVYSLIGHRWKKNLGGITKWRGWTIPDQDFKTWICPTFHPSYVERADAKEVKTIWEQDLKQAIEKAKEKFPEYVEPTIETITDLTVLNEIKSDFAFDYETTGLKPHGKGHRIVCCSIATSENHAYTFMMPETRRERKAFIHLLANPHIGKIAQNMKFEDTWSRRLGVEVQSWAWDTMIASHILDNRPGVTGLKFQVYVQFGIVDYASEVSSYFTTADRNANAINKIMELVSTAEGRNKLLLYCGLDSVYEYRLYKKQKDLILETCLPF